MLEEQLVSLYSSMQGRARPAWDFGSMSCIPLHFSSNGLFGKKLKRWGSTGSWSPVGLVSEQQVSEGVDMRYSTVEIADNYTKRKNVLRISTVQSRNELLLKADKPEEMVYWVRSLQEQTGAPTEHEQECVSENKQAVPQQTPAHTSVQVQGAARLSPQSKSKSASRTWRDRVAQQFKKLNQSGSPSSPTAPDKLTFGVPLHHCPMSLTADNVPRFVEMCTEIIEQRGLETVGIYRVPGNSAAVSALTDELNRGLHVSLQDARCDTNVVSSLLKSFFRKLPDSLLTSRLYPRFIQADKIEEPKRRLRRIKAILHDLPDCEYDTLKHLILHLRKVVDNSEVNKMEARNLAIMFGPTLVRSVEDNMVTMVTDMSHQCRIVESLLLHADWFFNEEDGDAEPEAEPEEVPPPPGSQPDTTLNSNLLLENISKIEGIAAGKDTGGTRDHTKKVVSSIISAANRKIQRKPRKAPEPAKEEAITPTGEPKEVTTSRLPEPTKPPPPAPATPPREHRDPPPPQPPPPGPAVDSLALTYPQRDAKHLERIEKFRQETMAMLQKKRRTTDLGWERDLVPPPREPTATTDRSTAPAALPDSWEHREDDGEDSQSGSELMSQITSIFDDKMKALQSPVSCLTVSDNIPYADESPDLQVYEGLGERDEDGSGGGCCGGSPKSFRDPSLHKSSSTSNFAARLSACEKGERECEKDVGDEREREVRVSASDSRLKRSESLSKPQAEKEAVRLKRSVSLSRAADRLTKVEKTESNINLRRGLERKKLGPKLKRKNGMPERGIKRRHTVGGTKDFDKSDWFDNKVRYEAELAARDNKLRTSSPDLAPLESHI